MRAGDSGRPIVARVPISHADRVVFPQIGITKVDVARYYEALGDWILPHLKDRPLTLVRCPAGAGTAQARGECFFMKHSKVWAPAPIRRVRIREKTKVGEYLIADSIPAVVGLVQMGVLEIHTWNTCFASLERPNRIVIDLDPGEEVGWPALVTAARLVRAVLAAVDLESFVKTTGGRGLHVVVPLVPRADWSECLAFARAIAEALARKDPDRYTLRFAKAGREQQILVDYLRNNRTNTSIAAYSTRAKPNAPISVPLTWTELTSRQPPDRWTMPRVLQRLARLREDPWAGYWKVKQRLPRAAEEALRRTG
jgi:bifunctional non-homologous end joining protein LigD